MFEAIQYLVSSKKLEDGFGMDNVLVVNGRGKITRSCEDNIGLDVQFIHYNIARVLHDFLNDWYGIHEHFMSKIIHILIFIYCFNLY